MIASRSAQPETATKLTVSVATHGLLQRAAINPSPVPDVPPIVHEVLRSPGQPLDAATRSYMEPRLGHDFSGVRVHTDAEATESARAMNALAYTTGQHIVFEKGHYVPATPRGRYVLAHELAHTLQQQAGLFGSRGLIQRIPADPQGVPFDGEIIPWSAALHASPSRSSKLLADLPRGQVVSVRGGRAWIQVETAIDGTKLTGYVSHELIRQVPALKPGTPEKAAEEAADKSAKAATDTTQESPTPGPTPAAPTQTPAKTEPMKFPYNAGLDPELKTRFNRMVIALDDKGIKHAGIADIRPKPRAHLLSTAYHIREKGAIPVTDLQGLKDGQDLDGNVWYKKDWEQVSTYLGLGTPRAATSAEISEACKTNAFSLAQSQGSDYIKDGKINCAYEGYEVGDAHRTPNVPQVPISNHVSGHAIDLSGVEWSKLGGDWSDEAWKFVASFGLTRPYSPEASTYCIKEHWHFELA